MGNSFVLRENLVFSIHFCYDYYMYIGTVPEMDTMSQLATKYKLYCEEIASLYFDER